MTYSEACDHGVFDWNAFLNKPAYTAEELKDAYDLANNWVTCACGNQCTTIKRWKDGCPEDRVLEALGRNFMRAIDELRDSHADNDRQGIAQSLEWAKDTLASLEHRAEQLLKEES
jgi:hypothetical protein